MLDVTTSDTDKIMLNLQRVVPSPLAYKTLRLCAVAATFLLIRNALSTILLYNNPTANALDL